MRPVSSLGCRTDLMLIGWEGRIDELDGGVLRARSPSSPEFYYGNFLLFPDAPTAADPAEWPRRFAAAFADAGIARFQAVETAPTHRRRGICATLVHHAARHAHTALGAETLVMVAVPNEPAASVYASVGFTPTEHLTAALLRPPHPPA